MTSVADDALCVECAKNPAWSDDRKRGVPWNLCTSCAAEVAAGIRRRRAALARMQPLADLLGPGVASVTITFHDNGPRR